MMTTTEQPGSAADQSAAEPIIALVVAVAENGVIGAGGGLPWRIPSELKAFRKLTMGKPVIMGRRTFESLKKPLDGRENIVVTRASKLAHRGCWTVTSIGEALDFGRRLAAEHGASEVMVIGGAQVYQATLPLADRIYWTEVHAEPAGDTHFPPLEEGEWREISRTGRVQGDKDQFAYTVRILDRVRGGGA